MHPSFFADALRSNRTQHTQNHLKAVIRCYALPRYEGYGIVLANGYPSFDNSSVLISAKRLIKPPVSLRLGHATALTPHRGVIHSRVAASLPHWGRWHEP